MERGEAPSEFEAVFEAHYSRIARAIARMTGDAARAEELAAEVFWKLWRNPRLLREEAGAWLYRAAVRTGLNELRHRVRRTRYEGMSSAAAGPPTPEEAHAAAEERDHVRLVLASMKPRQAELLLLRASGLSYEETAAALGISAGGVGTLLGRAQQAFRKEYVKRYGHQ